MPENINFTDYQREAHQTARYLDRLPEEVRDSPFLSRLVSFSYIGLKLSGEAGEFSEKLGKIIRDKGGVVSEEDKQELIAEGGDVLWYLNELFTILDISLEMVAKKNLDKLADRDERGVIHGDGDNR